MGNRMLVLGMVAMGLWSSIPHLREAQTHDSLIPSTMN